MADGIEIDPAAICASGVLTAADVVAIRAGYYKDGIVSEAEADALFAIEQSCKPSLESWSSLFVEALTDYLVRQVQPRGYVTVENAAWLTARIAIDNVVQSRNEFDLLVAILEDARWAPASLTALALSQVHHAVAGGKGPLRAGTKPALGVVTAADVAALRRILYAAGGDGNIAVTRIEAEALMDIGDIADETLSDPSWIDLYAKAIANHLMAASGYAPPSRQEALRHEAWLEAEPDFGGFLTEMVGSGLRGVWDSYHTPDAEELALARLEDQKRAILVSETITEPEARWLIERITKDGRISEAEHALLSFIKTNSPKFDPALNDLMAAV